MNDVKTLKKALPPMENSFSITDLQGVVTGQKYNGNFISKIPNIKSQALIEKHKAVLNGDSVLSLDPITKHMHHMLAYLRYVLTETPKWWKDADSGYDLYDGNVIEEVYARVMDFESKWMESVWGPEKSQEGKAPNEPNASP